MLEKILIFIIIILAIDILYISYKAKFREIKEKYKEEKIILIKKNK
jgi:hypothetical protein